jgi:uncharacterized protein YggE
MSHHPRTNAAAIVIPAWILLAGFQAAMAADPADRITLTVTGKSLVKPDVAEIHAVVTGSAAVAVDALKKFGDNRRRAIDGLKNLKLANLTVDGAGPSLRSTNANSQRMAQMFGGNANAEQPGMVTVSETLTIKLSGIDGMKREDVFGVAAKIVDAAKDAGLALGGAPQSMIELQLRGEAKSELMRFRATRYEETRTAAVKNAMKSAYKRAEEMAAQWDAKVLRVVSVREGVAPSSSSQSGVWSVYAMMLGSEGGDRAESDAAVSAELKPIPISVVLEVQFATAGMR